MLRVSLFPRRPEWNRYSTPSPAFHEFDQNEHSATTIGDFFSPTSLRSIFKYFTLRFLENFGYNEHPTMVSTFTSQHFNRCSILMTWRFECATLLATLQCIIPEYICTKINKTCCITVLNVFHVRKPITT